jgi:hypothetical protein
MTFLRVTLLCTRAQADTQDTVVIIYKLRNCQDYDTDDLHKETILLFIHSEARPYVQQIHPLCTEIQDGRLSITRDPSTKPVPMLGVDPLSTILNYSYFQIAYLKRTSGTIYKHNRTRV